VALGSGLARNATPPACGLRETRDLAFRVVALGLPREDVDARLHGNRCQQATTGWRYAFRVAPPPATSLPADVHVVVLAAGQSSSDPVRTIERGESPGGLYSLATVVPRIDYRSLRVVASGEESHRTLTATVDVEPARAALRFQFQRAATARCEVRGRGQMALETSTTSPDGRFTVESWRLASPGPAVTLEIGPCAGLDAFDVF
jgi:hypothetical protein